MKTAAQRAAAIDLCLEAPEKILAGGGGALNPLWRQIQADILGLPLVTIQTPEKSATGAAMLAGIGTGVFSSFDEACQSAVAFGEEISPNRKHFTQYEAYYQHYRSLYPKLQASFMEAAQLSSEGLSVEK